MANVAVEGRWAGSDDEPVGYVSIHSAGCARTANRSRLLNRPWAGLDFNNVRCEHKQVSRSQDSLRYSDECSHLLLLDVSTSTNVS